MRNNNKEPRRRYKLFMIVFITHVLGGALEASLPSNTLFLIIAKISHRALKLGTEELRCILCERIFMYDRQVKRTWSSKCKKERRTISG